MVKITKKKQFPLSICFRYDFECEINKNLKNEPLDWNTCRYPTDKSCPGNLCQNFTRNYAKKSVISGFKNILL
jgi:hypothetical protein